MVMSFGDFVKPLGACSADEIMVKQKEIPNKTARPNNKYL
jgi:hypothetical protein